MIKNEERPLNNTPALREACVVPITHGVNSIVRRFISQTVHVQKLSASMASPNGAIFSQELLLWYLTLSAAVIRINYLETDFRAMDYELVTLSSRGALDRIQKSRASVGLLRKDLADTRAATRVSVGVSQLFMDNGSLDPELKYESGSGNEAAGTTTPQQISSSPAQDYAWVDKQAADLMPLLNENLQLIAAQISIEQTEQSLELSKRSAELADVMARDSAISIKNGERSTLLTLLAAIYLPLTLATGIFGMNIKEILDHSPRWWAVIAVSAGLTAISGFIAWLFFTRTHDVDSQWEITLHRFTGGWWGVIRKNNNNNLP